MKRASFLVVFVLLVGFIVCAQAADITIGVDLSTTGPGSALGIPEKNALAFAPQVIAGHTVRYVVYDDGSDSTSALQNMKRLISEEKPDLLLGPSITTATLGVIDAVSESGTPMIALASASQIVSPVDAKRRWIFKTPANDSVYNRTMVEHMAQHGIKTVSVIAVDDPYGESNTQEFQKLAAAVGIKTLDVEKYQRSDTSVTGQVLRALQGKPDAVFVVAVGTVSALPQIALAERNYKGRIYHTGSVANNDFLRVGGKKLEGALVPTSPVVVAEQLPDKNPTKAAAMKFLTTYETKFGQRSHFAAQMWDALNIIQAVVPQALKTAEPGTPQFREALRTAIENTQGFVGASAVYNFSATSHAGIDVSSMCMVRVENGSWKLDK
jgi:branched-chain amino acid transport system substrate-binding protein